ncbi:hypothetical protein VB1_CDS0004 [Arthrobacter phage Marchesin]|nr:hypothetical protein VB1_CDS0004 [Arthrobacter phage Marchesin]
MVLLGALVVLVAAGLREYRRKPEPAPSPDPWAVVVARRCVVNLRSGSAIDGVLVRKEGPLLFLKNAALLEQGQQPAQIDGEAVVQCSHVDFIQAL